MKPNIRNNIINLLVKLLLRFFHLLPDGLKLYFRSFKKQEPELNELIWLAEKSTIAIDVGANKGAYTYALSKIVGKSGRVIAVEPIEELAKYLRKACAQLFLNVTVKQYCLSFENGFGDLFIPLTNAGELLSGFASLKRPSSNNSFETRKVTLRRMDDMLRERELRVSFIKCDVEGHEIEVFKGALDILKRDRPNLLVEIEQRHIDWPIGEQFDFFLSQNYKGYFLNEDNRLVELNEFDSALYHAEILGDKNRKLKKYVYNFIFVPIEVADTILSRHKKSLG